MPKKPLTVDDLWALPRVGLPAPSPDGTRLLVPVTTYSIENDAGTTRLWVMPADATKAGDGGRDDPARALTTAEASSGAPAWSPDGTRLAFVRKPGDASGGKKKAGPKHSDQAQLYAMNVDGGEAERLTDLPLGVIDPKWFPDGRRIAFLARVHLDAPTPEGTAKRVATEKEDPVTAHVTEESIYRYWDQWLTDRLRYHVFVLDLETSALTDLTPKLTARFNPMEPAGNYAIAPNGREVAYGVCRTKARHDPPLWSVYTVTVPAASASGSGGGSGRRPGRPRDVTPPDQAHAFNPRYSPDGGWILMGVAKERTRWSACTRLAAWERRQGRHHALTGTWDRSAAEWVFDPRGRRVYVLAADEGRGGLFSLPFPPPASRRPAKPRRLARGGVFSGLAVTRAGALANMSTLASPPEIVSVALDGSERRAVTAFTGPVMRTVRTGRVEDTTFAGADDDPVQMFIVHPPETGRGAGSGRGKRRRRRPLVHFIHGGPHASFSDQWHWRWNAQVAAAPGYVVALVNFHGSDGWGHAFTDSIVGTWGDKPYEDVMKATDVLIDRGIADPKRMAATGGSYGGYMASWIASQTDRFACIVNHAGVCDLQTQFSSDIPHGFPDIAGGAPWKDQEGMDRYNPIRHARGFRSPMLVLHGEKDYRVPYYQGLEIYNVYKSLKRPARLVVYPHENHWILKPGNSRHWYGEVLGWLKRWL